MDENGTTVGIAVGSACFVYRPYQQVHSGFAVRVGDDLDVIRKCPVDGVDHLLVASQQRIPHIRSGNCRQDCSRAGHAKR